MKLASVALGIGLFLTVGLACGGDGVNKIGGVRSELVGQAQNTITSLASAPDGRLFFTEQNTGRVGIVTPDGQVLPQPFVQVDSDIGLESGLMAVAIDPEFEENHHVYIYFVQPEGPAPAGRPFLMRYTDVDNKGVDGEVLVEFPPANPELPVHVGAELEFGPDGYLYLTIGETEMEELAQDRGSLFGKVLRMTRDGEPAPDNPFVDEPGAEPRVYAYGFRNPYGLDFDPETGQLYVADNGPSTCDELNLIEPGENYGWPESLSSGEKPCENPGAVEPIYHYAKPGTEPEEVPSNVAPTGVEFVSGDVYPSLGDGLLVCEFITRFMRRLQLTGSNNDQVADDSVVVENCTVALTADDEGVIYYSNGIEILRLVPE